MSAKKRAGLLAVSPDGRFVLDPFAGMELVRGNRVAYDVDSGYGIYDATSGDMVAYSVGTDRGFHIGAWMDNDRFLLVGTVRVDSPIMFPGIMDGVVVPTICVGDLKRRIMVDYLGAPLDFGATGNQLGKVIRAVYPKVNWHPL